MSSETCLSSEASIQEVSLSVPSYPVQQTRYNSFQACHWLSILESRISEILNSGLLSTIIGGAGLYTFRDQVWGCWFQHGYMENWVYSAETVGKL